MGGTERYRERVESQLAPCLAHFAAAAGKDSLWKPLNHQLLLKSRHSDSQVGIPSVEHMCPFASDTMYTCTTCVIVYYKCSVNQCRDYCDTQVRFALLKVLEEIYTKLGEEFMVLLPETIPYLAELMEGEHINTSHHTHTHPPPTPSLTYMCPCGTNMIRVFWGEHNKSLSPVEVRYVCMFNTYADTVHLNCHVFHTYTHPLHILYMCISHPQSCM